MRSRLPSLVLTGHDIHRDLPSASGAEANVSTTLDALAGVVQTLRSIGYTFVTFGEFMDRRRSGGVALLTFDDAYRSVARYALPVLASNDVPALLFVISGGMCSRGDPFPIWLLHLRDRRSSLERGIYAPLLAHPLVQRVLASSGLSLLVELLSRPLGVVVETFRLALTQAELAELSIVVASLPEIGRLTMGRQEIYELLDAGLFELGAHSVSHRSFTHLTNQEIDTEITASTAAIAEISGMPSSAIPFAYPYGAVTAYAVRVVSRNCRAGLTCHSRPLTLIDSAFTIPRINLDANTLRNARVGNPATRVFSLMLEKAKLYTRAGVAWTVPDALRNALRTLVDQR